MMSDEYVLRDERGNPLSSIFHNPPIRSLRNLLINLMAQVDCGKEYQKSLLKLCDSIFPPIEEFHPDDMKGDEEE